MLLASFAETGEAQRTRIPKHLGSGETQPMFNNTFVANRDGSNNVIMVTAMTITMMTIPLRTIVIRLQGVL